MANTRSRREVRARSPNLSDVEDVGSDSDYSPGSLMIDMGADGRRHIHVYMQYLHVHVQYVQG